MSDPERWRDWRVGSERYASGAPITCFYAGVAPANNVRSTGEFDALVFEHKGERGVGDAYYEMFLHGEEVRIQYDGNTGVFDPTVTLAKRPLPETLEELIQWARMVQAVHGGEHE